MDTRIVLLVTLAVGAVGATAATATPAAAHDCYHVNGGFPPSIELHPEHCVPGNAAAGEPPVPGVVHVL